jgi:uncharacterized protein (TIRG00374 family)
MKRLLRPSVLVPLVIGVALLAALLGFSNAGQVVARMASFQRAYLVPFLLLMVAYEAVRCVQWHFLLGALGIRVPLRTQVFTFATGEVTKSLPVGNFFPDYVLQRSKGTDFGLASSATLMITLIEVVVSLAGIVIIGIDGWGWLRPLIVVGVFSFGLLVWSFYRWHHTPHPAHPHHAPAWARHTLRWKTVQKALDELRQFAQGEARLLHPHVIGTGALFGATYLLLGGAAFFCIVRGLGLADISYWQTLVAYFFSLAFAAIVPLPMDFGSTEISGAGVFVAMGVSRSAATSIMLLGRVLTLGATLVIALITSLVLRGELRAALATRPGDAQAPTAVSRPVGG